MGIHGWKKVIAITVLIAFIGVGLAWAMEQGSPQFQEKAGTPVGAIRTLDGPANSRYPS